MKNETLRSQARGTRTPSTHPLTSVQQLRSDKSSISPLYPPGPPTRPIVDQTRTLAQGPKLKAVAIARDHATEAIKPALEGSMIDSTGCGQGSLVCESRVVFPGSWRLEISVCCTLYGR